jgi:hypothetical protein
LGPRLLQYILASGEGYRKVRKIGEKNLKMVKMQSQRASDQRQEKENGQTFRERLTMKNGCF